MRRRSVLLLAACISVLLAVSVSVASASWVSTGVGSTVAQAVIAPAGNVPAATVSGRDVTLSWTASSYASGILVAGYVITRYDSSGVAAQTMTSGSCLGTVTATSCSETAVPPGTWNYTVTPAAGSWRGAEGSQVAATVGLPALTLSPTTMTTPATLTGTIANFVDGETLQFHLDSAAGTLLAGTVAGTATPTAVPIAGGASVTVTLPATGIADGPHAVYAVSAPSGESASVPVTINNAPLPTPTITSSPGNPTSATAASFAFTDSAAVAYYQCKLDAAAYATCTSPITYSGLSAATHSFSVVGVNGLGTVSAPATYSWTISLAPPNSSVTFPLASSTLNTAGYTAGCGTAGADDICGTATSGGGANPAVTSVQVSIQQTSTALWWNGTSFAAAAPPWSLTATGTTSWSLTFPVGRFPSDDGYVVQARAVNAAGTIGAVAGASFTLDNVAPGTTTITSAPAALVRSTSATFAFTNPDASATFQCLLDVASYAACPTPTSYSSLANGTHTFSVRGVDQAGNLGAVTSYSWTVDTVPPVAPAFTSRPANPTSATAATFAFTDAEAGVTFNCSFDGSAFAPCSTPKSYSGLTNGTHIFSVTAQDAAGNVSAAVSWTWLVDTVSPTVGTTFPAAGAAYSTTRWTAGCAAQPAGGFCGTAADSGSGVASVSLSIQQAASGSYWNGTTFGSLTPVSFTATGTTSWSYPFPAGTFPADGSYTLRATAIDGAALTSTSTVTFLMDRVAPTAVDVRTTNAAAGTAGLAEAGDTLIFQFSEPISPATVLAGWSGASTTVDVRLVNGGGTANDLATIWTAAGTTQLPLGSVDLGAKGYITKTEDFMTSSMVLSGSTITITLSAGGRAGAKKGTASVLVWTPSATVTDPAGNPMTTTPATGTGGSKLQF